jgi:hypothetical protein
MALDMTINIQGDVDTLDGSLDGYERIIFSFDKNSAPFTDFSGYDNVLEIVLNITARSGDDVKFFERHYVFMSTSNVYKCLGTIDNLSATQEFGGSALVDVDVKLSRRIDIDPDDNFVYINAINLPNTTIHWNIGINVFLRNIIGYYS